MNYNIEEVSEWEKALYERKIIRVYGKKSDSLYLKKSKLKYHVDDDKPLYWWTKECPKARKLYQKSFRRKMKQHLYNEVYYHIRNRDFKTYGYLTW